jgi:hypothetical protein
VERINDESVKLKTLQTSLTLMQIPELAQNEVYLHTVVPIAKKAQAAKIPAILLL